MNSLVIFRSSQVFFILIYCILIDVVPGSLAATARANHQIQEFQGFVEGGSREVYTLNDLKKGDTLYAYMTGIDGNLDPFLGIVQSVKTADHAPDKILKAVVHSSRDLVTSFNHFTDNRFLEWDDDSGNGYDASLQFQVPEDGTYFIFAESTITNQTINSFQPEFTSGSFRLLIGLNAPEIAEGKGKSTGKQLAIVEERYIKRHVSVQQLDLTLSEDKLVTFYHFKKLQTGDVIFARIVSTNGSPLPKIYLTDFGSKPIVFGNTSGSGNSVLLKYHNKKGGEGLRLYMDASDLKSLSDKADYRLQVGINAPIVIKGEATEKGNPVLQQSKKVEIGLSVDQISNVDQQSENFSVVGSLQLAWLEPALAFSPDKCDCSVKKMGLNELKAYAQKKDILLPLFIFFNQQGNRWVQGQHILIDPSGRTTYHERFTVTLQEPGFDFRAYPFDRQQFNIRIDFVLPTEVFLFESVEQPRNALGDQLGEEEWSVIDHVLKVETVPMSGDYENSRFIMSMEVERHLNYYIVRILIPLLLIITVSWVIFFLKDYGRQLEVASGNLLVFVAFNFTISNDLPRLGYLTLLDRMIITSFCCAALVVLISVCQKRLEARGKGELASKIDNIVLVSYPLVYMFLIVFEYLTVTL